MNRQCRIAGLVVTAALASLARGAAAQGVDDPYSFRGAPLGIDERSFHRIVPGFSCDGTVTYRVCSAQGDARHYGDHLMSAIQAEFTGGALCRVSLEGAGRPGEIDRLLDAMNRHLGPPRLALVQYADGREAMIGSHNDPSPAVGYYYRWDGARSYVAAQERFGVLRVQYSSETCDARRAPRPPRRQM